MDEEQVYKRHPVDVPTVRHSAVEPNQCCAAVQAPLEE